MGRLCDIGEEKYVPEPTGNGGLGTQTLSCNPQFQVAGRGEDISVICGYTQSSVRAFVDLHTVRRGGMCPFVGARDVPCPNAGTSDTSVAKQLADYRKKLKEEQDSLSSCGMGGDNGTSNSSSNESDDYVISKRRNTKVDVGDLLLHIFRLKG